MAGVPRPDLALFNGWEGWEGWEWWEGGSGDEQATDLVENDNSESNMFSENEKKVFLDSPIDEEVKDDLDKLETNQELCGNKQILVELCKSAKGPDPLFTSWLEKGFYCTRVEVGGEEATDGASDQVLAEPEGTAPKLWIDMIGGVKEVKIVHHSEVFAIDLNDSVDKQVSKVGAPESNRRPKQGEFFSSLDNMTKEELSVAISGTSDIKTPLALLDKLRNTKEVKHLSQRKEATIVQRRSPRKQMKLHNLMKEFFDDSSLSVASQGDITEEEDETEAHIKSVGSEKWAKKSKQEKNIMTSSVWQEVTPTHRKIEEKSFPPPKSDVKYLGSKKNAGSEISATPPALQRSPAQKSKSKKASGKSKTKKQDIEPVAKRKVSISSVFEVEDDPYVLEIQARKKRESEKLAMRTKVKIKGRMRESISRMAEFTQCLTGSERLNESSQESSSDEMIPKMKKPRKKKKSDPSQKEINSIFKKDVDTSIEKESNDEVEEASNYTPSIDELLKLPERPEDGGKTMDEVLDDLDIEIAERKKKHEEEMSKLDTDIADEKQRQEDRRERMKKNVVLRDRLEVEITKLVLRRMFEENTEYLRNIEAGRVESSRHQAFHKSSRTRHALYYTMITDPFTDDQLEWTLEEMGKVWMKTKREQMNNNEYVWKVLLAECFIKFYMDHFRLDKKEAEKRISETPLRKAVDDGEEDNSSDEDL